MKFYEGSISYWELEELPIDRLESLNKQSEKIVKQMEKAGAK